MSKRILLRFLIAFAAFIVIAVALPSIMIQRADVERGNEQLSSGTEEHPGGAQPGYERSAPVDSIVQGPATVADDSILGSREEPGDADIPPPTPPPVPHSVDETHPDVMLASTDIMVDGRIVDVYEPVDHIDFGPGSIYSWIEGVTSFRGNNYRDSAAYGYADIQNARFGGRWSIVTGSYTAPDGAVWSGHGWTGQPLIVKWPKETRAIMNMYDWAKEQEELIEVVYAAMDGYIYFAELETGSATRAKIYIGIPFKGSGALDPRGYPLLYVGAGYSGQIGAARIFIISLVDGSVLYTFGLGDGFAPRNWTAADASPLVDAETDTLIYPSENGVLYIIKLNSEFDPSIGLMTIDPPAPVKWRYIGRRSQRNGQYWLGIESSPAIWRGYVYLTDNGGHLICLDLNTLEPVWVQDVYDDTNGTPVIDVEDGYPYIYISTSFHGGWRAPMSSSAPVPIWKIDAITGETVWMTIYSCYTESGVSGGVQATAALGRSALSDLVFIPFARTPTRSGGILAALDKATGDVVWEFQTSVYSWSSPVCVYDSDGNGYIVYCNAGGNMYLLDGLTGELLDTMQMGGNVEASPAVYNSTIVVGTRTLRIWGVQLT